MSKDTEQYIEHEVRLRLIESQNTDIYRKFEKIEERIERIFDKLDSKIHSNFLWTIGLIGTSIVLPVILHLLKLI
jgi:hypothetical protein